MHVCASVCLGLPPWQIWWEVARRVDGAGVQWWAPSWANTYYHHFNWRLVGGFSCRVCREADSSGCWHHSLWAWLQIFLCSMWRKPNRKRACLGGIAEGTLLLSPSQNRQGRMKWQFQFWCKQKVCILIRSQAILFLWIPLDWRQKVKSWAEKNNWLKNCQQSDVRSICDSIGKGESDTSSIYMILMLLTDLFTCPSDKRWRNSCGLLVTLWQELVYYISSCKRTTCCFCTFLY